MNKPPHSTMPSRNLKPPSATALSMQLAGLGAELAAPVLIGAYLNQKLNLGITPVLIGLGLGILSVVTHVVIFLKKNPELHGKESNTAPHQSPLPKL